MTTENVKYAIEQLKNTQKIFHSEADFQFSLAWQLQKILPNAKIRLEYCPAFAPDMHIDIYVLDEQGSYPIELKYKTKRTIASDNFEVFNLKNHGAQDLGRYDYLFDVNRVERMKSLDPKFVSGYAIILTNDSGYWTPPVYKDTIDSAFRIYEGRNITGTLSWGEGAGIGTIKDRDSFHLSGQYQINWLPFSDVSVNMGSGVFNYCLLEVK